MASFPRRQYLLSKGTAAKYSDFITHKNGIKIIVGNLTTSI
jgi:hypothetical protein